MFTPREVLISIGVFFCAVGAIGAVIVGVLMHLAKRNEAEQKANEAPSIPSGTHHFVSR